jgi:hypothetical protein
MSTPFLRLSGPLGVGHPVVLDRRVRDLALLGAAGLIPLLVALSIALEVPDPNFLLLAGVLLGAVGIVALLVSTRYEVTLAFLALYFGLLDGPIKLESASQGASAIRDVLIAAISVGAVVRIAVKREHVRLPPLSGWVIAFVVLVLIEAFNPETKGITKALGGFRQQLEWIPFFFFGYIVMRSKERFRKFFLILGVIALVNGVVSTIQTQLTPAQLASWGPGYRERVYGEGGISGRVYYPGKSARVRPPALGSDIGFGGYVGVLALPGALALLAVGGTRRKRALALLLCVGALLAIATSLQREAVLGGVAVVVAFGFLSLSTGRATARPVGALLALVAIVLALGLVIGSSFNTEIFSRYTSIAPSNAASTTYNYRIGTLSQIPIDIKRFPFGAGLATVGAGAGFGGAGTNRLSGESQYNYVTAELGLVGLLLWVAFSIYIIVLAVRSIRRIADVEIRLSLSAVFAAFIAFTLMGFGGSTMSALPFGPYFWLAVGIASYWFKMSYQRSTRPLLLGANQKGTPESPVRFNTWPSVG